MGTSMPKNAAEGGAMDEELKRYLDGLAANIAIAMREMEARILSAIDAPHVQLDAMARKLEGEEDSPTRTRAGL
jgi:hypothetical protein